MPVKVLGKFSHTDEWTCNNREVSHSAEEGSGHWTSLSVLR